MPPPVVVCCTLQGGTWVRRYVQPDRPTTGPRARPTEAKRASRFLACLGRLAWSSLARLACASREERSPARLQFAV